MPGEEIGDEEGRDHVIASLFKGLVAHIEREAMGALDTLDPMGFAHLVEFAAGSAVGVPDENVFEPFLARLADGLINSRGDSIGIMMIIGIDAFQVDMVVTELPVDRQDFAANHSAGDDTDPLGFRVCWFICASV
jgi:hypothetical protein